MISVVIASYKEPRTIGKAIKVLAPQLTKEDEIIVTAPDEATRKAARAALTKGVPLVILVDKGKGKPAALNRAIQKAKNPLLLLTDGDVFVSANAVALLKRHLANARVGIVTGRVIAANAKKTMLGFWAYALSESFHELRLKKQKKEGIIATGYLYLIRKNLFSFIPEDTLADDAYISHRVLEKGYSIVYEPHAEVYVKYPTTLPDWLRQKKRTAGRVYQLAKRYHLSKLHSFTQEVSAGVIILKKINSLEEVFWLMGLFVFKLYVWARVFFDYRLWKRTFSNVWQRVESTK